MKRFFFILVAFSISILANAQSLLPTEFFGLEFGKKYSPEQLILHVEANGYKGTYLSSVGGFAFLKILIVNAL